MSNSLGLQLVDGATSDPVSGHPVISGLPFLGISGELRRDPLGTLVRASAFGPITELALPLQKAFLVSDPALVRRVFVDGKEHYGKKTRGYDALRLFLGQGLVTSEGSFWKRQRRIAQPAFHKKSLVRFSETMVERMENMLRGWHDDQVLDFDEEMMQVTLQIVGECLLSVDLSDSSQAIGRALPHLLRESIDRIMRLVSLPLWVPTPSNLRVQRAIKEFDDVVFDIISQRKNSLKKHEDLLAMLMLTEDAETGERMTEKQLRDEVITLVSAGHETTSNALSWTFYLLSQAPEIRERAEAEVDAVLGDRSASVADLPALPWIEAIVKEAMRIYPPVWLIARSADSEDTLGGVPIPKGSLIFCSPWVTQRLPEYFENPEGFDPRRFMGDKMDSQPKYSYFPFGGGARICIGNGFAMMEAVLLTATILSRYRLDLVPGHPVEPEPTITVRPRYGMKMIARRRQRARV